MTTALFALLAPAFACGGFFGPVGRVISSDAQQAFFRVHDEDVSVEYRVRYTGTAQDFAWVLPVPGVVEDVQAGDDETFDAAEQTTAPSIVDHRDDYEEHHSLGCAFAASSDGGMKGELADTGGGGVMVEDQGFAGDYEYVVLSAEDGDDLKGWLAENGFDVSTAGDVIDAYVADPRGIEWVAVKVRQDVASPDVATRFTPLRIRYGAGRDGALHADFPARMGSTSTSETNHLEVYVLGEGTATVGEGWGVTTLGEQGYVEVEDDEDVDAYYDVLLADVGGDEAKLARVWSGGYTDPVSGEGGWLTRFDTIVAPSTQATDIALEDLGPEQQTYLQTTLALVDADGDDDPDGDERSYAAAMFVGVGVMGAGIRRRKR